MIVENRSEDEFVDNLGRFKKTVSDFYKNRYKRLDECLSYTSNFMAIFLISAMKHNKRKIIDTILVNENLNNSKLRFPENIDTGSIYYYVTLKLLQNGHNISNKLIPAGWLTSSVMKDFLDSQISYHGHGLIEVNCSFMLHPHTMRLKVETEADVDISLVFYEDKDTLSFLLEDKHMMSTLTHPVVSTYINLKSMKFQQIFSLNYKCSFFFIFYFFTLMFAHFERLPSKFLQYVFADDSFPSIHPVVSGLRWIIYFGVLFTFTLVREIVIIWWFENRSFIQFLCTWTNFLNRTLIVLSAILFTLLWIGYESDWCLLLIAMFVLTMFTEFLSLVPGTSTQQYTMIAKIVAFSFLKFLLLFGVTLVPFSCCFCILFRNRFENRFFLNFHSFKTALFKLTLMLAGEYTVEPVALHFYENIFVFAFILTTFWLFALILGFSTSDIADLKRASRKNILEKMAQKILRMEKFLFRLYKSYE